MKTTFPGLLVAFLAGAGVMSFWVLGREGAGNGGQQAETHAGAGASGMEAAAQASGGASANGEAGSPSAKQVSSFTRTDSAEAAKGGALQRKLMEIRQAPEDERQALLGIYLDELAHSGAAGRETMLEYLRSGKDIDLTDLEGNLNSWMHGQTLRAFLDVTLLEATKDDPGAREAAAGEILGTAKSLREVGLFAQRLGAQSPAIAAETEAAVLRLAAKEHDLEWTHMNLNRQVHSVAIFQQMVQVERDGYGMVSSALGAVWDLSEDDRRRMTGELLADQETLKHAQSNPAMLMSLDVQMPTVREAFVNAFRDCASDEARARTLEDLANTFGEDFAEPRRPGGEFPRAKPGFPGGVDFSAAQLQALDQIAPYCTTPRLQAELAGARAHLTKLATPP